MSEGRRYFVKVSVNNLSFPIKIGLKSKLEGRETTAGISINAEIEKDFENEFENNVLEIINRREEYTGPMQLSTKLINYIDSLNAKTIDIKFNFPFYLERFCSETNKKHLIKYPCEYSVSKLSLVKYKRKYRVGVPFVARYNLIPGIQNLLFDIPAEIIVEIAGFETFFIEDIINTVEKYLTGESYSLKDSLTDLVKIKSSNNFKLNLLEKIKYDFLSSGDIDSCSVEFVNKRIPYSYAVKLSSSDKLHEKEERAEEEILLN